MTTADTIQTTDVTNEAQDLDAADLFLKNLIGDAGEASTEGEEDEEEAPEATEDPEGDDKTTKEDAETEEAVEEPEEDPAKKDRRQAADDDEIVVQVGDEAKRVSVKDLKRLYGQEAALTRKGQELADTRRGVDAEAVKYTTGLTRMASEAAASWAEYEKIDYLLAKDSMTPDAFAQLRQDATKAHQAAKYYGEELQGLHQTMTRRQQETLQASAVEAVKAIKDPTSRAHISDWSNETYDKIRTFAVEEMGVDRAMVDSIVEPWAIKVLHLAMKQAAVEKAAKTIPAKAPKPTVKSTPKTVLKSREAAPTGKDAKSSDAMSRLSRSGSVDDAAAAFLASFGE